MASDNNDALKDAKLRLIINYLPQKLVDKELHNLFSTIGKVTACRIVRDSKTAYSFGYGFVTYENEEDADRAIGTLNGFNLQDKRIKVSYARPSGESIKDTNLYVTNLPKTTTEDDLENSFGQYGTIVQKNLLKDKLTGMMRGVAFVRYDKKEEANAAMVALNGTMLEGSLLPLQIKLAEEHGKQKAAYFAGLQTGMGMALKNRMGPAHGAPNFNNRGRGGQHNRFNPMGRGGYQPNFFY